MGVYLYARSVLCVYVRGRAKENEQETREKEGGHTNKQTDRQYVRVREMTIFKGGGGSPTLQQEHSSNLTLIHAQFVAK